MTPNPDGDGDVFEIPGDSARYPACDHDAVEGLGYDGSANRYFRCPECDSVLVREGYRFDGGGASDDLGTVDPRMEDLLDDIEAYHDGRGSSFAPDRPKTVFDRVADACRRLLG